MRIKYGGGPSKNRPPSFFAPADFATGSRDSRRRFKSCASGSAAADAVDQKSKEVGSNHDRPHLDGVGRTASNLNDGKNGEKHKEQCKEEPGSGSQAQPERGADATVPFSENGNREQGKIGEAVESESPVLHQLKRFLHADTDKRCKTCGQRDTTQKTNGVDRSAVLGMGA